MLQDQQGYIWIGTRDGLNRYNGYETEIFRKQLSSTFIYSLLQDSRDNIWIGTSQGGVVIYSPEKETFSILHKQKHMQSLEGKDIYNIFEDRQKNIWLCTLQGLAQLPPSSDTVYWYADTNGAFTYESTSFFESDGACLAGTEKGIFTIDTVTKKLVADTTNSFPDIQGVFVRDIAMDNENIWVATDDRGIFSYDRFDLHRSKRYSSSTLRELKSDQAWKLFRDSKGFLWVSFINGGLFRFDPSTQDFNSFLHKLSPPLNAASITGIMEDRQGNFWIATHGDGVCYFNPGRYVFEKYLSGNAPAIVSAFAEDEDGGVWIGTDGSGVKKMKGNVITDAYNKRKGLSSDIILDIAADKDKGAWLATWQGGVNHISADGKITVYDQNATGDFNLKSDNVKALLIDSLSNLWIATHGRGIALYNIRQKKFIDPLTLSPSLQSMAQWGSDILKAKNGDIWIASHAGLFRYRNRSVMVYTASGQPNAISSALIYCLFEDSKGTIWVGTNTSLERYVPAIDGFENYTVRYRVPGNIKCILEDDNDQLWISTIDRLVAFNHQTKRLNQFTNGDNIQQGQFYECSCLKTSSGKMYFGGTEGFNAFWPDSVADERQSAPVLIADLYVMNQRQFPGAEHSVLEKALPLTSEIQLSHSQNVISLHFLSLNFATSGKQLYSYRLDGFDKDWSSPSESRMVTYTNLNPGEYTFHVRSYFPNTLPEREAILKIKIAPAFWMTLWFRVVASAVSAGIIIGYFLLRLHWSRQKRKELQQLVDKRTAEISQKNRLLEHQKEDLERTNTMLLAHEKMISEQAGALTIKKNELERNNAALLQVNHTKDTLFSIIAHDLRSPFTSLLGVSKLLKNNYDYQTDSDRKKLINTVHHAVSSVHSLLENLLLWSKSQQESLQYTPQKLQLSATVLEHFDLISDAAEKKNVQLVLNNNHDVSFYADAEMLNIIIRNLLSNAVRYSPVGGVVEVGYSIDNGVLKIFVKDEGMGIDDPEKLFQVTMGSQSLRDHNHGLGLILCKDFVARHGGSIAATNNEQKGACFSFTLPFSDPSIQKKSLSPEEPEKTAGPAGIIKDDGKPLIMIIEDDDDARWYMKQALLTQYTVVEAINGVDAQALIRQDLPDMIISDISMPKLDGVQLCNLLKSNSVTSHIPFLLVTADRSNQAKVSGFRFGADDYITKPVDCDVLCARVRNIFESRQKLKLVYQRDITLSPHAFTSNAIDQEFLERINALIEKRINDPELNPDSLAADVNMSRTALYMKIKALTGESVGIYVRNVRLKESRKLLKEKRMNISEVAYAVGFNQLAYFTTCFKEAFGLTPTEFLRDK